MAAVALSLWLGFFQWLLPGLFPEAFRADRQPETEAVFQVIGKVVAKEYRESYGKAFWEVTLDEVQAGSFTKETSGNERLLRKVADEQEEEAWKKWKAVLEEGKVLCTLKEGEEEPLMGQRLLLEGSAKPWEEATNPGQFDFGSWYRFRGIYGQLKQARVLERNGKASPFRERLWKIRQWAKATLNQCLGEEEGPLLAAMVLGEKGELSEEIKSLYQKNGLSHLLSISGLHLTLLGMGIFAAFQRLPVPSGGAVMISMLLMMAYCIFTGGSVATIRATIMFCVLLPAGILGRSYDSLSALGLAAIFQLILNPCVLQNSGFQLSFLAVVGVSAVVPRLNTLFSIESKLLKSLMVSIGVTLTTLPVLLYHFGTYAWHSILLNLLVLPLMPVLLWLGLLLLLLAAAFSSGFFLCQLTALGIKGVLSYYELCCRGFTGLPVWEGYQGRPLWISIFLFYTALVLLLWLPHRLSRFMCFLGLLACIQLLTINPRWGMEITMMDVGQGDGMVIRTESGRIYLSDFGSSSVKKVGTYRLLPFLKAKGYSRIEGIFVSHLDQDHYNGILELLEAACDEHISIATLFLPISSGGEDKVKLDRLLELAEMTNLSVVFLQEGDYVIDGKVGFFCLHPGSGQEGEDYESNNGSMVLSVEYGDFSLLLTGDVEKEGEEKILDRIDQIGQYDLLKVAHHGSGGSSTAAFLEKIQPKVSLISCGKNNPYGHPAAEVLDRLAQTGSVVLQTPETGAITIRPKRNGSFTVETFCQKEERPENSLQNSLELSCKFLYIPQLR